MKEDIPKVVVGQTALVRADAFPGEDLTATVARITPKGDPVLKNYRVYLDLPKDTPLHIGMTTEINIVTLEKPETVLVPVAALDGQRLQTVSSSNTVETIVVETGITGTELSKFSMVLLTETLFSCRFATISQTGRRWSRWPRARTNDPSAPHRRDPCAQQAPTDGGVHTLGVALGVGFSIAMAALWKAPSVIFWPP